MSVWDDSWGACDARGVRGDRGMLGETNEAPNTRLSHHAPGPLTTTRTTEEVAGMTPAYLGADRHTRPPVETEPLSAFLRLVEVGR